MVENLHIHVSDAVKHIIDAISLATVLGTLTAWLPPIAALVSIIWTSLRIYEVITGKEIAGRKTKRTSK
jgi:hypothetical protein